MTYRALIGVKLKMLSFHNRNCQL